MIDSRVQELINAAMDGELNDSERAELEQGLKESPQARDYQTSMQKMDTFLKQLPEKTVPHNLHAQMINAIDLPTASKKTGERGSFFGFSSWPGFVRYGLATAAGLLVAVGIYEMSLLPTDDGDLTNMVGTVVPATPAPVLIDSFSFQLDGHSNSVNLELHGDAIALDVNLEAEQTLEIIFDFSKTSLAFDAVDQAQTSLETLELKGNKLRVAGSGQQHFTVFMHRSSATFSGTQESIVLEIMDNGQSIQRGELVLEN